jgi:hypothetical protein
MCQSALKAIHVTKANRMKPETRKVFRGKDKSGLKKGKLRHLLAMQTFKDRFSLTP